MISSKVRAILISMGAPFTSEEMEDMTDRQGWAWIYEQRPPKTKKNKGLEICFTGFDPQRKAELKEIAVSHGFHCVTCVTKNLSYLCVGVAPGPVKLKEAKDRRVKIITEDEFNQMVCVSVNICYIPQNRDKQNL